MNETILELVVLWPHSRSEIITKGSDGFGAKIMVRAAYCFPRLSIHLHRPPFLPSTESTAQFVGNPHIVAATRRDYAVPAPQVRPTFPEPLPAFLPRTVKLPTATAPPPTNPSSANAGRFSLSLKGMRKELRRQGGRAGALIRDIEGEMMGWLAQGGTVVNPDAPGVALFGRHDGEAGGRLVGETEAVVELARTPLQLVWRIPEDAFARYVVHCVARYHEVVSFSEYLSPLWSNSSNICKRMR
jgi:hypothetical protein